jgi:glycosyltransferase involved in cell wall biosynthesis
MEKECCVPVKEGHYTSEEAPLVSVAMIAYNVSKYLEEAIESVIIQKTNFKVELVIGEDCSTDNTREIALAYQAKYPEVIRVLLHEKNLGLTPNSVATQNACLGKYIALLDGDDYWTDEWKLHKQVQEMERIPSYSACAHQALIIKGNAENPVRNFGEVVDREYSLLDTISHRKFHTSSLLYRKELWKKTGGIPENISSNERAIYPMLAVFGKIKYLKDNMCVYRLAPTGLNSRISSKELETDLNMLPWLKGIDKNFPVWRFRSFLHLCAFTYPAKMSSGALFKHWFQFSLFSFSYFPKNLGDFKHGMVKLFEILKRDF